MNSLARTIQTASQANEVDDYGLVAKGKNGIHKSIHSRRTAKTASYNPAYDVSIDGFGYGVIAASNSKSMDEMPLRRRSSTESHQSRRPSHNSSRP
jgi:hypothetical protein